MYNNKIFITLIIFIQMEFINNDINWREISEIYGKSWMVRITSGMKTAIKIAQLEGFSRVEEMIGLENLYHFHNLNLEDDIPKEHTTQRLYMHAEVSWAEPVSIREATGNLERSPSRRLSRSTSRSTPNRTFSRSKSKSNLNRSSSRSPKEIKLAIDVYCAGPENSVISTTKSLSFNDPLYRRQWFMRSCDRLLHHKESLNDVKVVAAWKKFNVYGRGIKVIVADDGVYNHLDLQNSLSLKYSTDLVYRRNDPTPLDLDHSHGTKCAGIIAMEKDNGICGVGIAPEVTLGAIRMTQNKKYVDLNQAEAFAFKNKEIDILLHAYSLTDGATIFNMEYATYTAIKTGITEGRRGKGILYVVPAGNGKPNEDLCSCDPLLTNIHTIVIAGARHDGKTVYYSERCANIMVTMYSGDGDHPDSDYNIVTVNNTGYDHCDKSFNGTSASSPMAAGALALVLEANGDLTWREIQHVLAWTSEVAPLANNPGWYKNAAGFYISLDFGFGLMDVYKMVELAKEFESIPPMRACLVERPLDPSEGYINRFHPARITYLSQGCKGTPYEVNYIEHVELMVKMSYSVRGDVRIFLTSPSHTMVQILERRSKDKDPTGIFYVFDSLHTWGEQPRGYWHIDILDSTGSIFNTGVIERVSMTIYGTREKPFLYENGPRSYHPFTLV